MEYVYDFPGRRRNLGRYYPRCANLFSRCRLVNDKKKKREKERKVRLIDKKVRVLVAWNLLAFQFLSQQGKREERSKFAHSDGVGRTISE